VSDRPSQPIFVPYWMLFLAAPIFVLIAVACALAGKWIFVPVWLVFAALWVWLGLINRRRLRDYVAANTPGQLVDADLDSEIPVWATRRLLLACAVFAGAAVGFATLLYLAVR
jgi:hypothetical protein